jgi:hypothetical protein
MLSLRSQGRQWLSHQGRHGVAVGGLDHRHAVAFQIGQCLGIGGFVHLPLLWRDCCRDGHHRLLVCGRQSIEAPPAHRQDAGGIGVARQAEMLLHLPEAGVADQRSRVLLSIHRPRLQRGEKLREGQRRGIGAQDLEGLDMRRVGRGADLQPAQIGRAVNRAAGVGNVAETNIPEAQNMQAVRLQLPAQAAADFTI